METSNSPLSWSHGPKACRTSFLALASTRERSESAVRFGLPGHNAERWPFVAGRSGLAYTHLVSSGIFKDQKYLDLNRKTPQVGWVDQTELMQLVFHSNSKSSRVRSHMYIFTLRNGSTQLHIALFLCVLTGESGEEVRALWDFFHWLMGLESTCGLASSAVRALEGGSDHAEGGSKCLPGPCHTHVDLLKIRHPKHPVLYHHYFGEVCPCSNQVGAFKHAYFSCFPLLDV